MGTAMHLQNNFVWIDLEMTGLELNACHIIEIAAVITDNQLNIIDEKPSIAIHHSDDILDNMNEWCIKTHGESGLTNRVKESDVKLQDAENIILDFISKYTSKGKAVLCGNSIWQDRRFLGKYMPKLEEYFHYRMIDVSTIKILNSAWQPASNLSFKKSSKHLALDDIHDSINELKHYRTHLFRSDIFSDK